MALNTVGGSHHSHMDTVLFRGLSALQRGGVTIYTAEGGTNHKIAISTVGIERLFTNYPFW